MGGLLRQIHAIWMLAYGYLHGHVRADKQDWSSVGGISTA